MGPNSVLRESMFAGNQFFYSSKSNLISWVLFFSLLYWWRNWECVSHLPKDTQLRRCGTSPSLPSSPASLPTKLSSHHFCSQGQILLHHSSRRQSSEEQRDWPNTSSLVRWQSWIDLTLLTLCLSVAAFPSIMSLRQVREVSVYALIWGIWTLRPSVLKFRSQRLHHISKHMFPRRWVRGFFFFHNESYFKFMKSYLK